LRDNHSLTRKCDDGLSKAANFRVQIWGIFTVLDRTNSSPAERITALVGQLLAKRSIRRPVGRDEDLTEAGLTSLDLVNLMLAVEAEFDIKISDRDMTPANFRAMARIDALVGALLAKATGE
jgi:acyl carrier protein